MSAAVIQMVLAMHGADEPVTGCECRERGPKPSCPAWLEAKRYHMPRAQRIVEQLHARGWRIVKGSTL